MKTGLVITTINQVNKNIKDIDFNCNSKKWDFYIIGDVKTPKNFKIKYGNYLNTDFNMDLIIIHLFIVFMFYVVVLILSNSIDVLQVEDDDDKITMLHRIEIISTIIFIFTALFILVL